MSCIPTSSGNSRGPPNSNYRKNNFAVDLKIYSNLSKSYLFFKKLFFFFEIELIFSLRME